MSLSSSTGDTLSAAMTPILGNEEHPRHRGPPKAGRRPTLPTVLYGSADANAIARWRSQTTGAINPLSHDVGPSMGPAQARPMGFALWPWLLSREGSRRAQQATQSVDTGAQNIAKDKRTQEDLAFVKPRSP